MADGRTAPPAPAARRPPRSPTCKRSHGGRASDGKLMPMRARLAVLVLLFAAVPLVAQSEFSRASVVAAMNVERALRHLPPLREAPRVDAAAADRADDMPSLRY